MKIVLAVGTLQIGGTESQLVRLAREFTLSGNEVYVLAVTSEGPLSAVLEESRIPWRSFDFRGFIFRNEDGDFRPWRVLVEVRKILSIWAALWRFRPDVCHAFLFWSYVLCLPGSALLRVPVRISGRRGITPPALNPWLVKGLERLVDFSSSAAVANSNAVADDATERRWVPRRKIRVIPNGVDIPPTTADPGVTPCTGAMVANFIAYKGHIDLVRALALLEEPPLIRLIGDGIEREVVQVEASRLEVDRFLKFEGRILDARRIFLEVQFAVLTSHEEGFPNAVLEAMAAGLPVIATSVGGIHEVIEDELTGLLVPPQEPALLAQAIARVASDPDLRIRLGVSARARARDFGWERVRESHLKLYRDLLEK